MGTRLIAAKNAPFKGLLRKMGNKLSCSCGPLKIKGYRIDGGGQEPWPPGQLPGGSGGGGLGGAGLGGGQLHAGQLRGAVGQRGGGMEAAAGRLSGGGGSLGSNAAGGGGGLREGATVSSVSAVASAKVLASRRAQVLR